MHIVVSSLVLIITTILFANVWNKGVFKTAGKQYRTIYRTVSGSTNQCPSRNGLFAQSLRYAQNFILGTSVLSIGFATVI